MPTILYEQGFRFSFYSADGSEPPHVHVRGASGMGKWWLDPIREARSKGFTQSERSTIEGIIRTNQSYMLGRWNNYFREDT